MYLEREEVQLKVHVKKKFVEENFFSPKIVIYRKDVEISAKCC